MYRLDMHTTIGISCIKSKKQPLPMMCFPGLNWPNGFPGTTRLSGVFPTALHDLHEVVYERPGTNTPCATIAKHSPSLRHTKHIPRLSGVPTEPHRTLEVRRLRPHSAFIFHR
jgi:hypothetical protein